MTRENKPSSRFSTRRLVSWALAASFVALGLGGGPAQAADSTFSLDFGNAYIWRGIVLNDSGVAQFTLDSGSLNAGSVPIGFNVWGNWDIGDFDGSLSSREFSEIDLTVHAGLPAGFEVGLILYEFPQVGGFSTQEMYVSWSKEMVLTPSVAVYYDFGAVDSFYASADATYSIALGDKTSIDLTGLVGMAAGDYARAYGGEEGGFYNYNLTAGISHQFNDVFSLSGSVGYSGSLDDKVLPDQPLGTWVLAGVSFAF